jgi:hypothetical protein
MPKILKFVFESYGRSFLLKKKITELWHIKGQGKKVKKG